MTVHNAISQMRAKNMEAGKYADGQGLWLFKSRKEAGKWILRLVISGKRREMGLGRWPDVSIGEARRRAEDARRQLRDGVDPIEARAKQKVRVERITLGEAVEGCFEARQAQLKSDGKAGRWLSPLTVHILPKFGSTPVEDIDQHVLKRALEPIWHQKPDTARKAMNRLNLTLKHAAALGLDVDLQATMKARALLGKRRHEVHHIPSLAYAQTPAFYQSLQSSELVSVLALRFLILTAARTSEVRFASLGEIDDGVWHLPASRTKTGKEHRVPLSSEALEVLSQAESTTGGGLMMFLSPRGKALSDAAISRYMQRAGLEARPHGFRATFRTWVEETTDTPYEVKESALGHQVDSGVERAYQRSDRLEKRAVLMSQWAEYLTKSK